MKLIEVRITQYDDFDEEDIVVEEYTAYGPHDAYSQAEAEYPDATLIEIVGRVS